MERVRQNILQRPEKKSSTHNMHEPSADSQYEREMLRIQLLQQQRDVYDGKVLSRVQGKSCTQDDKDHLVALMGQIETKKAQQRKEYLEEERASLAHALAMERDLEMKEDDRNSARREYYRTILAENLHTAEEKKRTSEFEKEHANAVERDRLRKEEFDSRFGSSVR